MLGVDQMARPKKGAKKPDRPSEDRVAIVHLKGSPEYAAWLDALHQRTHIGKATLVRLALSEWAERNGHPKPPEL
jgi:hypothetical protein